MSSRGDRWYIFSQVEGTDEYAIVGWSKQGAAGRVEKLDKSGGQGQPTAFKVWAATRNEARKMAVEVFEVKVWGYMNKEEKKTGQALVKAAVMRAIFCPYTGQVLDMRRAVYIHGKGQSFVCSAAHWDSLSDKARDTIRKHAEVYDGRELFKR